ncbi:MAG TPA: hypothetical protein VGK26_06690 [Thermoanaerobaculia bacterium]
MADSEAEDRLRLLETEIERRLSERFAALREEFDRLRLESDRRWFGFLERFDQDLKGVVPGELLSPTGEKAPGPPKGFVSAASVRALDLAGSQVDVLHRFLDECRRFCSRAALLVARGGTIGAWKAAGFSEHGGDDETVRRIALPQSEGGLLARVMGGTAFRLTSANEISTLLKANRVAEAVVIPMVVREKISGTLYADCVLGEENRFDPEALGLLTYITGLAVDRLASRKLKPAPALKVLEAIKKAEPAGMWMNDSAAGVEEAAEASEPAEVPADEMAPPSVSESERGRGQGHEDSEDREKPATEPSPEWRPIRPTPPPSAGALSLDSTGGGSGGGAASGLAFESRRLTGPLAVGTGDERREEARRFARLLVSEIKLYNERAVLEGREGGNLYARLKEDIDRSRQMYNDRIPEDVRGSSNFFYEELVRILAEGRAEALGL